MADEKTQIKKLTPMVIHDQEFTYRGRKGYDRQEVDRFLDKVVDDYGDTLDETVDLKNEIFALKQQITDLQAKNVQLQGQLTSAQIENQQNSQIVANAHQEAEKIIAVARDQAEVDTSYQKQQQDVIKDDYERLKQKVAEFRHSLKEMLQVQIDDLDDENWQHALDKYFHTDRFYPFDGSEPIPAAEDEDLDEDDDIEEFIDDEDSDEDDEVDNLVSDDVNFEEKAQKPQPMEGDSSNNETVSPTLTVEPGKSDVSGSTIVFPDDYKDHN